MSKDLNQTPESINARRKDALSFLKNQLSSGTKHTRKERVAVPLTPEDKVRINEQIAILLSRIF